jgi:hypothetical protein
MQSKNDFNRRRFKSYAVVELLARKHFLKELLQLLQRI